MQDRLEPTTEKNVAARLFFRYFLCYFAGILPFLFLTVRLSLTVSHAEVGFAELLFPLLALLGGFLTVSKPYLLILCAVKAFYDAALLHTLLGGFAVSGSGFFAFNALLFYLVFALVLFCICAARASLFSFDCTARDFSLILSRPCLRYLAQAAMLGALSLTIYYLWPQLLQML